MAHRIVMPSFGMYTAEGMLIRWLRPSGSRVEVGEPVVEVETEKAVHEIEAPASGVLHSVARPNESLPVEALIGYVLAEHESVPVLNSTSHPDVPAGDHEQIAAVAGSRVQRREVRATPIARKLASEHKIDLASLSGSGPGGRVVEADVRDAIQNARAPAQANLAVRESIPLTGMRRTIAERLRYAFEKAVALTLTREVPTDNLQSARLRLGGKGIAISYDTFFIKALAMSLRRDPRLNASVQSDSICVYDSINVGFAVAVPGGLFVPVVHEADRQSLAAIEATVRRLSEAALAGRLSADDMKSGTVTLTNLGAYGVDAFTPVLNPPQAAVFGIGRISKRAVVKADSIVVGSTCILSLTFDHRVCDGAPAAQLLAAIGACIGDEQQLIDWA